MQPHINNPNLTHETLSDYSIKFISNYIYQRTGIVLGEKKRYLIENRLKSVARFLGMSKLSELIAELANQNPQIEVLVVDSLTTNETSWFRDKKPFVAMKELIFPMIAQYKPSNNLNIWSAACSTGQEPYSLAMLTLESGWFNNWYVKIFATDISTKALSKAKMGIYSQLEVSRGLPVNYLVKYFNQQGEAWQIKPCVKKFIHFQRHFLQNKLLKPGAFDLIFCRNVLIYFDDKTKQTILNNIYNALSATGLLVLGSSETTLTINSEFEFIRIGDATFYSKAAEKNWW